MKGKSSICSVTRKDGPCAARRRGHRYVIDKQNPPPESGARPMTLLKSQNAKREPACAQAAMEGAGRAQGIRETAVDPRPEA